MHAIMMGAMLKAKEHIQNRFREGVAAPPPPLSDRTLATRKARKDNPSSSEGWLYDTGRMIESLEPMVFTGRGLLVGGLAVPDGKSDRGMRWSDIVDIVINGAVIHISGAKKQKVMRWLFANNILNKSDFDDLPRYGMGKPLTIVIPPRGDILPQDVKEEVSQIISNHIHLAISHRLTTVMRVFNQGTSAVRGSLPGRGA